MSAITRQIDRCYDLNRILLESIDELIARLTPVLADRPIPQPGMESELPPDAGPVLSRLTTIGDGIGTAESRIRSLFECLQC